ncbi:formylglycine-generating enzyme family protein (plasmid) [Hymenobacter tibetensis]|uniref:Formylglycine-generating enzyme family protein n=1 Tax=Hymenobacter tibetensis TaxID=497967 RepID=A0ABY4DBH6_9BACT|nr:formylglycine-generating enzyme family protein [Hymenobacter tibetensis]UOG77453.1 formylglycine-generating enzyme family protein [Hymenobacter tibetensis]
MISKPPYLLFLLPFAACRHQEPSTATGPAIELQTSCHSNLPQRFAPVASTPVDSPYIAVQAPSHQGMVWVKGGRFQMGATDREGRPDEYPAHSVQLAGFWIDATEVTNAQFAAFVQATGYQTVAERKPNWEELKKQLPTGTPKPADELLVAASLTFSQPSQPIPLNDASQWWRWTPGANWRHPQGPQSTIEGKEGYPVTQVAWEDAVAYARWASKRLPTEAEWEYAARGGLAGKKYSWGDEDVETGKPKANTWQGSFPDHDLQQDGFAGLAPVRSFQPNAYGLYDMAGNVWEWVNDWYTPTYHQTLAGTVAENPGGPTESYDPQEPTVPKKITRGGSFMCNASYCKGYRASAKMKSSPDTGLENTGFRCVSSR